MQNNLDAYSNNNNNQQPLFRIGLLEKYGWYKDQLFSSVYQNGLESYHEYDLTPPPFQLSPMVWLTDFNKRILEAEHINTGPQARFP